MAKWLKLYVIYPFVTSPHSCYRTTLLNTKVLNFTVSKENSEKLCQIFVVSSCLLELLGQASLRMRKADTVTINRGAGNQRTPFGHVTKIAMMYAPTHEAF